MRRETIIGLVFLLSLAAAPAFGELYFWTDENGIRHYSNQTPPSDVGEYGTSSEIGYDREADKARTAGDTEAAERMKNERSAAEAPQGKDARLSDIEAERQRLEAEQKAIEKDLFRKKRAARSPMQKQLQDVKDIDDQIAELEKSGRGADEIERLKAERKAIIEDFYRKSRYWKRGGEADLKEHQEIEQQLEKLDQKEKEQKQ